MTNWALYSGLAHKSDWSQRREDRKTDEYYAAKNYAVEEAKFNDLKEKQKAMDAEIERLYQTETQGPDAERTKKEFEQQKLNLIQKMAKYKGDYRKFMMVEGDAALSEFRNNFTQSNAFKDSEANKKFISAAKEAVAGGKFIGSVSVVMKGDKEGETVTKKMDLRDALKAYENGDVLRFNNESFMPEDKVKFDWKGLVANSNKSGEVTSRDVYMYGVSNGMGDEQARAHALQYQKWKNDALKNGNKNAGLFYNDFEKQKMDLAYEKINKLIEAQNLDRQMKADIATEQNKRISMSGSQRTGQSSGQSSGTSSGGTGGGGGIGGMKPGSVYTDVYIEPARKFLETGGVGLDTAPFRIDTRFNDAIMSSIGWTKVTSKNATESVTGDRADTLEGSDKFYMPSNQQIVLIKDKDDPRLSAQATVNMGEPFDEDGNPYMIKALGDVYSLVDDNGTKRLYRKVYFGTGDNGDGDLRSSVIKRSNIDEDDLSSTLYGMIPWDGTLDNVQQHKYSQDFGYKNQELGLYTGNTYQKDMARVQEQIDIITQEVMNNDRIHSTQKQAEIQKRTEDLYALIKETEGNQSYAQMGEQFDEGK